VSSRSAKLPRLPLTSSPDAPWDESGTSETEIPNDCLSRHRFLTSGNAVIAEVGTGPDLSGLPTNTFVPLVDIVLFLALFIMPGQHKSNAYGERPMFLERCRDESIRDKFHVVMKQVSSWARIGEHSGKGCVQ
jgi:hypothetical protein